MKWPVVRLHASVLSPSVTEDVHRVTDLPPPARLPGGGPGCMSEMRTRGWACPDCPRETPTPPLGRLGAPIPDGVPGSAFTSDLPVAG
ncbi:hypothetical protein DPEC_G00104630 [Dallia pectoralis]|uniref:Uncharacterized protein n=1 Tax=Dallia pectoralis TaxID=75939 RepID=A0ACC2GXG2_DALPE|nr:hypothetical protein DPEC_G00104630 [Dallia pectoralis]